jgi:hypothetical protein
VTVVVAQGTSASPLRPFEPRGVAIDKPLCDLKSWNNHRSIE